MVSNPKKLGTLIHANQSNEPINRLLSRYLRGLVSFYTSWLFSMDLSIGGGSAGQFPAILYCFVDSCIRANQEMTRHFYNLRLMKEIRSTKGLLR
jgi:hypothetical protein